MSKAKTVTAWLILAFALWLLSIGFAIGWSARR